MSARNIKWQLAIVVEDFRRWRSWGTTRRIALRNCLVTWRVLADTADGPPACQCDAPRCEREGCQDKPA